MSLNAARLMPGLTRSYWGICLYLAKASCQAASESGVTAPMIGCHSVMERPEPVRRVAPPRLTIRKISAATANSHARTAVVAGEARHKGADNARCCAMAPVMPVSGGLACGAWSPAAGVGDVGCNAAKRHCTDSALAP